LGRLLLDRRVVVSFAVVGTGIAPDDDDSRTTAASIEALSERRRVLGRQKAERFLLYGRRRR
jgi:hypothetical protein